MDPAKAVLSSDALRSVQKLLGETPDSSIPYEVALGTSPLTYPRRFGLMMIAIVAARHEALAAAHQLPFKEAGTPIFGPLIFNDAQETSWWKRCAERSSAEAATVRSLMTCSPVLHALDDVVGNLEERRRNIPQMAACDTPYLGSPLPESAHQFTFLHRALHAQFPVIASSFILRTTLGLLPGRSDYVRSRGDGYLAAINELAAGSPFPPTAALLFGLFLHRRMGMEVLRRLKETYGALSTQRGLNPSNTGTAFSFGLLTPAGEAFELPGRTVIDQHFANLAFGEQLVTFAERYGYSLKEVELLSDLLGFAAYRYGTLEGARGLSLTTFAKSVMKNLLCCKPGVDLENLAARYYLAAPDCVTNIRNRFFNEPYITEVSSALLPLNVSLAKGLGLLDGIADTMQYGHRKVTADREGIRRLQDTVGSLPNSVVGPWPSALRSACDIKLPKPVERAAAPLEVSAVSEQVGQVPAGGHVCWTIEPGFKTRNLRFFSYPGMSEWPSKEYFACKVYMTEGIPGWIDAVAEAKRLNRGLLRGTVLRLNDLREREAAEVCMRAEVLLTICYALSTSPDGEPFPTERLLRRPRLTDLRTIEDNQEVRAAAVIVLTTAGSAGNERLHEGTRRFHAICLDRFPILAAHWAPAPNPQ